MVHAKTRYVCDSFDKNIFLGDMDISTTFMRLYSLLCQNIYQINKINSSN